MGPAVCMQPLTVTASTRRPGISATFRVVLRNPIVLRYDVFVLPAMMAAGGYEASQLVVVKAGGRYSPSASVRGWPARAVDRRRQGVGFLECRGL